MKTIVKLQSRGVIDLVVSVCLSVCLMVCTFSWMVQSNTITIQKYLFVSVWQPTNSSGSESPYFLCKQFFDKIATDMIH